MERQREAERALTLCQSSVRLFLSCAQGLPGLEPAQRHSQSAACSKKWSTSPHVFLNLGFPSYGDCKTFPQSPIKKLCTGRQDSGAVTALAAYLPVVPASPGWNNLFSSLFHSSPFVFFFFFPLMSKHWSCIKHLSKRTPYHPPDNLGVGSAQAQEP